MINLKEVITKYPECLESATKIRAYLGDLYPEERAKIRILADSFDMGIYSAIITSNEIDGILKNNLCKKLEDHLGYSEKLSIWCIESWIEVKNGFGKNQNDCTIEKSVSLELNILKQQNKPSYDEANKIIESTLIQSGVLQLPSVADLLNNLQYNELFKGYTCIQIDKEKAKKTGEPRGWKVKVPNLKISAYERHSKDIIKIIAEKLNNTRVLALIEQLGKGKSNNTQQQSISNPTQKDNTIAKNGFINKNGTLTSVPNYLHINVTIPKDVKVIGGQAFKSCKTLKSVIVPSGVTTIASQAFYDCVALQSIMIPTSVTAIGKRAFSGCKNLTEIRFEGTEKQWKSIQKGTNWDSDIKKYVVVFSSATATKQTVKKTDNYSQGLNIKDGVLWSIGSCTDKNIKIPKSVTSIRGRAFYEADIEGVVIPDSVVSIGKNAFHGCNNITEINIPSSVQSIAEEAFSWCYNLDSITVDNANKVYHSSGNCIIETAKKALVVGCKNSIIPTDISVLVIGNKAFRGCNSLTEIKVPENIAEIGDCAFIGCSSLKKVTIGKNVKKIGLSAFGVCNNLQKIELDTLNPYYHSDKNCLIETGTKTLIYLCKNSIIPTDGSVTKIGMFVCSDYMTEIVIPDCITEIGCYAFNLCEKLKSVTIGSSVIKIGSKAFRQCLKLKRIIFNGTKKQWDSIEKEDDWREGVPSKCVISFAIDDHDDDSVTPEKESNNIKTNNGAESNTYIYCAVQYVEDYEKGISRLYQYISDDENIQEGYHAIVEVGSKGIKKEVIIRKVKKYSENYPFPPENTKRIKEIIIPYDWLPF